MSFQHDRLVVYRKGTELLEIAADVADHVPAKWTTLGDQLRRAALSITLNISEGAGESSRGDKLRFYRIARRSTSECAATFSSGAALGLIDKKKAARAIKLLNEISAMLTGLIMSPKTGYNPTTPITPNAPQGARPP